jgi:hypothetical protein
MDMIGGERRPERAAGIAGRRLNPDIAELALAHDLAVGDAIERDAAGQAEVLLAGLGREAAGQPQHRLFQHHLHGGREVHVLLLQQRGRIARRRAEQTVEARIGHRQPGAIVEVFEIEPERAVGLEINEIVVDELREARRAVGREPHHLVLAGIDLEAGVVGEGRVQEPEAVGEMDFLGDREVAAVPDRGRRGGPFADAVEGEHRGPLERRGIERGGRVAQMVLAEQEPRLPVEFGVRGLELVGQQRLLEQLFAQPQRQRHAKRREAARAAGEIGLEQALELEERLVVEHDPVDVLELNAGLLQAIVDGEPRIAGVELLAGEALFLRGGNEPAVLDDRRGAVVIEGGEAEDAHVALRTACR